MASQLARTPIQIVQSAWKRIAPLELADNSWDNVSSRSWAEEQEG